MKAYKGFNRNDDGTLSCRGFIYEPGKTYKHEGKIELCESGFHACHELWQVWTYYQNNGQTAYYEVECGGDMIESEDSDGKFVCSEITLVKEVDVSDVERFDSAGSFSEGFAWVKIDGKSNYINTEGKFLSEQWFDNAWNFREGFAVVRLNDKWNFINTEGEILSKRWFDNAWNFSEGFAVVILNRKYNFINTKGELLSGNWFDDASDFNDGIALVKLDGKLMNINTKGELIKI
jgi:hypothetical protein